MTTVFNRIGPYQIIKPIGQGGMAVVFLAVDSRTDRQVALKLVQQGADREALDIIEAERFGAELQKQFSGRNAHVPVVYEYGMDDESGYFFVAMEYLDGANLSEVITQGPLAPGRASAIASDLCRFLEDAHCFEAVIDGRSFRSLLHLDLKPRNIRITSSGQVKVLDFGIAKALSLSRKVTRNDFGSIAYLSPERLESGEVDAHADFWALGVVFYEMLRGVPPFQAADTRRLERLILSRQQPPPLPESCPNGLRAIVVKLLAPTLTDRYSSAAAVRTDIERFLSGQRTEAEGYVHSGSVAADEPTRRTRASDAEAERTRRTQAPQSVPPPIPLAAAAAPAPTVPTDSRPAAAAPPASRSRRLVRMGLLIVLLAMIFNDISVGRAAARMADAISTRELDQLPAAWNEYELLSHRSYFGMGTNALERSLIQRTLSLAERVMANYRTPSPTVREAHWSMARDALARAVAVAGRDARLIAALRYCEGHLLRINGEAKKARLEIEAAGHDLTEAVVAFREAAELRPGWPDPFIGLARTFVYGLDDVDRGADALSRAQKHGHTPNEREVAQLADGYRARGNAYVRNARQLAGLPQERDYLSRAADAYRQALTLYAQAASFGNVAQNIRIAQRALHQVEDRLAAPVAPPPPAAMPVETAPPPATQFDDSASLDGDSQ